MRHQEDDARREASADSRVGREIERFSRRNPGEAFTIRIEFRSIEFLYNEKNQIDKTNFNYTEMVDTMVRQGMTDYYLGNEVGVMEKKRWIAWALALFMVATPCMTFAQEISGAAGSANESESNEPVKPDKASEQDCGDAADSEKGDSSAELMCYPSIGQ